LIGSDEHPFEKYLDTEKALIQISLMIQDESKPFTLDLIDYWDKCEAGASRLIRNGYRELPTIQDVLKGRLARGSNPRVIVENHFNETELRAIGHRHIGEMVATTGVVVSIAEPTTLLTQAMYRCEGCGWGTMEEVKGQFMPPAPKCEECGRPTAVDPMGGNKKTVQWIQVQEVFEDTPPNATPVNAKAVLGEALIDDANPGDRIHLVSIVRARRKKPNDANPDVELYLEVNSLKSDRDRGAEIELTDEDRRLLREVTADPEYISKLTRSIAPTLYDLEKEKLSIALQQCGGNIVNVDGERKRGSTHILLAGDPSMGKSKLLEWAAKMNPRSMKTTGPGSTAAGLTAATIRDEATGQYTLVAGAMVLADGGLVAADEFDKMRKEDRGAIHDAMEEQVIHVNKGGFNATMSSRCAILAACNPYGGQWNTSQTLIENIKNFPPALVARFDLIWIMINSQTVDEEMLRVRHVLKNRFHAGESKPPIDVETLRRLFAYARTITPRVDAEAETCIEEFYESVLRAGKKMGSTLMTMRMLEGIARLTEASAKLHLRETATVEDAELVIGLVRESLLQSGIDPMTGLVDANLLETGIPQNLRTRMDVYLEAVKRIRDMSIDHLAREEDVESTLVAKGFTAEEVVKIRDVLIRDGMIFFPRPRYVAIAA
jgi:replicative DNA helicase Mcm